MGIGRLAKKAKRAKKQVETHVKKGKRELTSHTKTAKRQITSHVNREVKKALQKTKPIRRSVRRSFGRVGLRNPVMIR